MKLEYYLQNLNEQVLKMSDLVVDNIITAFNAFKKENNDTYINDDIVDQYERLIEELCLDLLVKERPYSKDLRLISGILKMVSDLERIGDQAEDIMNFTLKLKDEADEPCELVEQLLEIVLSMVKESISSYIKMDVKLAEAVIKRDDTVDEMYLCCLERLCEKQSTRTFAIYTTLVVKYLERIADHAVNIAEWVVFIVNGFYKDKTI